MKASRIFKLLLAATLAVTTAVSASAAFSKSKTYDGRFTDVKDNAWYAKEVASAYELGFMDGMSDTAFSPATTVTVAQGITMASRVHAVYTGKTVAEVGGGQWYDMYVKYAKENGIIDENQFDSYTRELKRHEMAELFYDAMPEGYFNAINDVDYIPDVPVGAMYGEKLLALYNAGIVMGSDDYGTFNPDASIVRSECAAIINRVAIPENRVKGELTPFTSENAYTLVYNTSMDGTKEGINSGWVLDNRGGTAKTTNAGYSSIADISEKYATAWIREFNFIPKGEIVLDTQLSTFSEGAFVEYRDVNNETVYMIKLIGGTWNILGKDGKFTPIAKDVKIVPENNKTTLRVFINLDTGKSTTFINNVAGGTHDLLSDNVFSYRVGIDEKGKGSINMNFVNMVVNYNVYEDFEFFGAEEIYGWKTTGEVALASKQLNLSADSSAVKSFKAADGTVCTETYFYSKDGADFDVAIGNILNIKSVGKKLFAGDTELYTLTPDMWYRLRVEADTVKGTAVVFLNGQKKAEVKLNKNEAVSTLTFNAKGNVSFDFVKVYELHEYDDYVPVPEAKASMDDYIVGLNICSLWRNGTHFGWACVSPFDEPTTVLGYYDEGVPETADWEIKYMVEHGIDFQAFCWYADLSNGALKEPRNGEQLHNGFQYAKYSDYMKYCILFEAANGAKFNSNQFRKYVVPFWFENYFLDERYMTIDNKLVLPIFGADKLADSTYFGSISGVKSEFEYLEGQARKHGFDGVLFFACGSSGDNLANMGFDASYAYNWGTAGSSLQVNKDRITSSAKNQKMYTIPTISVGFDSVPWHQKRYNLMTVEDYAAAMEWVKNDYVPKYSPKYDWADNFMWLSTWNEYGEGTYICPAGLNGFGYVDVIREAFTDLPKEHKDIVPTLKQRERINHLYPQYARLLRRDGWYTFNKTKEDAEKEPANKLVVNGQNVMASAAHEIPPMIENGKVYFAFEPATCLHYFLNVHFEWRREAGTLLIEGNGHTVKMLVGSDRYIKDGKEEDLGYTLKLFDNVPMLDFVKLCQDLEYKYEEKDGDLYIYSSNYEEVWKLLTERKTGVFEFDSLDTEGWASTHMSLEVADGVLKATTISDTRDPIMTFKSGNFPEDFYTKKFKELEMKIRFKHDGGAGQALTLYYITDVDGTWAENKVIKVALGSEDSGDEWKTIKFDLTKDANWIVADRLTGLRFDPFNAHGQMEIDYIRFIEDPDFVYVPVEDRPIEILNGDAENSTVTFYSANATIKRIEDPFNKENHVWSVDSKAGKQWTYFRHAARYKENTTYKIDFDIKLVGNNLDDPNIKETSYCVNIRYADKGALNDFDHVVSQNARISILDGWVHCSAEYKTGKVDSNEKAEFTIYVNPAAEAGFDYYIDNLAVREVGGEGWQDVEIKKNENTEGSIVLPEAKPVEKLPPVKKGVITVNGTADESDFIGARSDNADITIVADPDDANNKVFLVTPHEGKKWTYFRYQTDPVRVGVEYRISYDFKYAGNNANNAEIEGSTFHTNVVYKHPDALNGFDHPVTHTKFTPGDGWMHCETVHIPEAVQAGIEDSQFAIYVDPVGDISVAYYVDNFTVEIIGGKNVIEADAAASEAAPDKGVISVNGNAEGTEAPYYSDNANIVSVVDPDNKDNKVWFVEPKEGKQWTYFRFPYDKITVGKTYKLSFDIKYAGNNANDDSIEGSVFCPNVVYKFKDALNGFDHPLPGIALKKGAGWVHHEVTHTVEALDSNDGSNFAIYVNPVGDAAISYYIDNFTVEIVEG